MSMEQPTSPRPQSNRSRGFSFHSQNSGSKKDYTESPEEKKRRDSLWKGGSKANPNAALTEAQPGVANINEQTTIHNLREIEHVDSNGNLIAEPDLSNPTRPRFERPLDTIRSFEKAIDNGYKRRSSYQKAEAFDPNNQYASRRSSYFGGGENGQNGNRFSQGGGGYYGGGQRNDSYNQQRPRGYSSRMQSEPQMHGGRPYNPQHNYHQSGDTVNTGMTHGSDSTGPWANSTDPSSENSSIDRNIAMQNQNGYGYNGTIMEDHAYNDYPQDGYGGSPQMPPQARYSNGGPVQQPPAARRPIPLGNSGSGSYQGEPHQGGSLPSASKSRPETEKRKSWLKRRFSKNS